MEYLPVGLTRELRFGDGFDETQSRNRLMLGRVSEKQDDSQLWIVKCAKQQNAPVGIEERQGVGAST